MGTVVTGHGAPSLQAELAEARALVEQGEVKEALRHAERVRRSALGTGDVAVLEQVLSLARLASERSVGKRQEEAGRLVFGVRQNIRFLGRKQALAEGRAWVDPFADEWKQSRPRTVASAATRGDAAEADRWRPSRRVIACIWIGVFVAAVIAAALFHDNDPHTDDAAGFGALAGLAGGILTAVYMVGGALVSHLRRRGSR